MKRYRLSALSAVLTLFLCGCSPLEKQIPESADSGTKAADRFDISAYKEKIETIKPFNCDHLLLLVQHFW